MRLLGQWLSLLPAIVTSSGVMNVIFWGGVRHVWRMGRVLLVNRGTPVRISNASGLGCDATDGSAQSF